MATMISRRSAPVQTKKKLLRVPVSVPENVQIKTAAAASATEKMRARDRVEEKELKVKVEVEEDVELKVKVEVEEDVEEVEEEKVAEVEKVAEKEKVVAVKARRVTTYKQLVLTMESDFNRRMQMAIYHRDVVGISNHARTADSYLVDRWWNQYLYRIDGYDRTTEWMERVNEVCKFMATSAAMQKAAANPAVKYHVPPYPSIRAYNASCMRQLYDTHIQCQFDYYIGDELFGTLFIRNDRQHPIIIREEKTN